MVIRPHCTKTPAKVVKCGIISHFNPCENTQEKVEQPQESYLKTEDHKMILRLRKRDGVRPVLEKFDNIKIKAVQKVALLRNSQCPSKLQMST